jgi:hypothetical protein
MLRFELLNVKADLERELGRLVLLLQRADNWFTGSPVLGVTAGHWAHREPAPHGEPTVWTHSRGPPTLYPFHKRVEVIRFRSWVMLAILLGHMRPVLGHFVGHNPHE